MEVTLHHVTLIVGNVRAAESFYKEHFGFTSIEKSDLDYGGAFLKINEDQQLHLAQLPDAAASFRGHFCVRVAAFSDLFFRFQSLGLLDTEAWGKVRELDGGVLQFYVRDPSGNLVEVNSYPEHRHAIDSRIFEQPEWGGEPFRWADS